jgi:demethylmenaquinone methyltransferase/2-methoxy-6-polyprenyl-1,4-benzoquinol methylase
MFDRIAPGYDAMNTLMTAGLDSRWRRATVSAAALTGGERVLDVACGTGKLAMAARAAVGPHGEVTGIDASPQMLEVARRADTRAARAVRDGGRPTPVRWIEGDAMAMPFADDAFDATLIGFGLRNLPDYAAGLAEMGRVTAPGGSVLVLEIARPAATLPRLVHRTWFRRVVPVIGRVIGGGAAYAYLPASLDAYPEPRAIGELMAAVGLVRVRWRWLAGGMVTLHVAEVPT